MTIITFENTSAFIFSDFRVQIVPFVLSREEKGVFKKSCFVPSSF